MAKAVGIDLGTTNSVVAATMEGGQAEVIPQRRGRAHDAVGRGVHR
jgi:molecular chaperone DnaK